MSIPEETLMAYVDGELGPAARAQVEAAMRDDPQIEKRVAQQRELKARIQQAYAADLTEAVPDRLVAAAHGRRAASDPQIIDLGRARAAIASKASRLRWRRPRWRPMASMAASLLIGVGVGFVAWHNSDSNMIDDAHGGLVAGGSLAQGLSSQLTGDRSPASTVEIGLSFLAKSRDYCRTFTVVGKASSAGLACRHAQRWEVRALAQSGAAQDDGSEYRTASSSLPPAIATAVEEQISGEPLNRTGEIAARKAGWLAAPR
ncbi:MAG: anti-sigma factor family protein [Steroidobacteraceae bacterium]